MMVSAVLGIRERTLAFGLVLAVLVDTSCGKENSDAAHPDAVRTAFLAQPCDELEGVSGGAPVAVFLQVASVQSPLVEPLGDYLRANGVQVNQVASMLVRMDKPALGPWGTCDERCESERTGTKRLFRLQITLGSSFS
jgi:hypothetical protein